MDIEISCSFCPLLSIRHCDLCQKNLCSTHAFNHQCLPNVRKKEKSKEATENMNMGICCSLCSLLSIKQCDFCKKNLCATHASNHPCLQKNVIKEEECKEPECQFCKMQFFKPEDLKAHKCTEICYFCRLKNNFTQPDFYCLNCKIYLCQKHLEERECAILDHEFFTKEQYLKNQNLTTVEFYKEGILPNDPLLCERKELMDLIFKEVKENQAILLKSPPYSGKTSTLMLAEKEAKKLNYRFCSLTMLSIGLTEDYEQFKEHWNSKARFSWTTESLTFDQFVKILLSDKENQYIIFIDEIQYIYSRFDKFWQTIKELKQITKNFRVFGAASYGKEIDSYLLENETKFITTPDVFDAFISFSQLILNRNEFDRFILKTNEYCRQSFQINQSVSDYIYASTNGHVGLVRHTIDYFRRNFTGVVSIKDPKILMKFLLSKTYIDTLPHNRILPVFPEKYVQTDTIKKLLLYFFSGVNVDESFDNIELKKLEKIGYLIHQTANINLLHL